MKLTYDYPVGVAGPLAKIMSNMVGEFNKTHPNIQVTPVFAGNYQQTLAKVETSIQGGNPPDVAVLNSTAVYDLLHLQAIASLDDVVSQGNYYPAFIKPKVDGHNWGVPFQRSTVVLYYNKDMFQKAGLDPTHGPNTWTELVSDAKTIKSKLGVNGIEIPSDGTTYWTFEPWATEAGQNLGGSDGKHVYFNSAAAKKELHFWMDLSHKYNVMPKGIIQWSDVPTDFENQKTAMITHSSGSMSSILKKSGFNVGVAFLPRDTSDQRTGLGGGDMFVMKGISQQEHDAAVTFVKWMTYPQQAAQWTMQTGYIGSSPNVYKQPAMQSYLKKYPQAKVPAAQLQYAQPELSTYNLNQVYDVIDSALQSVIDGQSSVDSRGQVTHFNGIKNYHDLFHSSLFHQVMMNTVIYGALSVMLCILIAFGLSLLLSNRSNSASRLLLIGLFSPTITPMIAGANIWLYFLTPGFGVVDKILKPFGLGNEKLGTAFITEVFEQFFSEDADMYICVGDVTHMGHVEEWKGIAKFLSAHKEKMFRFVLGNHDTLTQTKPSVLSRMGQSRYFIEKLDDVCLLFLDTTHEGRRDDWGGVVDVEQLEWIRKDAHKSSGPLLVFAHHPLFNTTAESHEPMMHVKNSEDLESVLASVARQILYFNGHNHTQSIVKHPIQPNWTCIQTASVLSGLCYRLIELKPTSIHIETKGIHYSDLEEDLTLLHDSLSDYFHNPLAMGQVADQSIELDTHAT